MTKRVVKVRLFFIWQASAEARWLEEMAAQGLALVYAIPFYLFKRAQPEQVHYCHDYAVVKRADLENYIQLYQDAGWERVMRYGRWFYFKSKTSQQVFSDEQTLLHKSVGILKGLLSIFVFGLILSLSVALVGLAIDNPSLVDSMVGSIAIFSIYTGVFAGLWYWRKRKVGLDT